MDPQFYLSHQAERLRYEQHENSGQSPGYLQFLAPFVDFLSQNCPEGSRLLDFGSGPEPVLAQLLREKKYDVQIYDLFFAPREQVFQSDFDGIYLHEVIEHLKDPKAELEKLKKNLRPSAQIFIRTSLHQGTEFFRTWSYPKDVTHLHFFSRQTEKFLQQTLPIRFL